MVDRKTSTFQVGSDPCSIETFAVPAGSGERPAVVLLDVDLPGVDGHAILERLGVEVGPRLVVEGREIEAVDVAIGGCLGVGVRRDEIDALGVMARGHESGSH